jgi:hypothetical protein
MSEKVIVNSLEELTTQLRLRRGAEYFPVYSTRFEGMSKPTKFGYRDLMGRNNLIFETTPDKLLNSSFIPEELDPANREKGLKLIAEILDHNEFEYERDVELDLGDDFFEFDFVVPYEGEDILINYLDRSLYKNVINPIKYSRERTESVEDVEGVHLIELSFLKFKELEDILVDGLNSAIEKIEGQSKEKKS